MKKAFHVLLTVSISTHTQTHLHSFKCDALKTNENDHNKTFAVGIDAFSGEDTERCAKQGAETGNEHETDMKNKTAKRSNCLIESEMYNNNLFEHSVRLTGAPSLTPAFRLLPNVYFPVFTTSTEPFDSEHLFYCFASRHRRRSR